MGDYTLTAGIASLIAGVCLVQQVMAGMIVLTFVLARMISGKGWFRDDAKGEL